MAKAKASKAEDVEEKLLPGARAKAMAKAEASNKAEDVDERLLPGAAAKCMAKAKATKAAEDVTDTEEEGEAKKLQTTPKSKARPPAPSPDVPSAPSVPSVQGQTLEPPQKKVKKVKKVKKKTQQEEDSSTMLPPHLKQVDVVRAQESDWEFQSSSMHQCVIDVRKRIPAQNDPKCSWGAAMKQLEDGLMDRDNDTLAIVKAYLASCSRPFLVIRSKTMFDDSRSEKLICLLTGIGREAGFHMHRGPCSPKIGNRRYRPSEEIWKHWLSL